MTKKNRRRDQARLGEALKTLADGAQKIRKAQATARALTVAVTIGAVTPERILAALPPDAEELTQEALVPYLAGLDDQAWRTLDGLLCRVVNRTRRK